MNDDRIRSVPALKKGVGFRRILDEGVTLVAETSSVNVLNEPACRFLELVNGERTVAQILSVLEQEYAATTEEIRRDVDAFLDRAVDAKLVELTSPTG
jgi:hypothetical protein